MPRQPANAGDKPRHPATTDEPAGPPPRTVERGTPRAYDGGAPRAYDGSQPAQPYDGGPARRP
ncbi:hypothetical protein AAHZ94_35295, partial [Streptomyces sp. HSW2009]